MNSVRHFDIFEVDGSEYQTRDDDEDLYEVSERDIEIQSTISQLLNRLSLQTGRFNIRK